MDGKHLMHFQSETLVFKFFRPSVDWALEYMYGVLLVQKH